jgi:hypothetical protein
MESTGVYWVPVYTILEGAFELVSGGRVRPVGTPHAARVAGGPANTLRLERPEPVEATIERLGHPSHQREAGRQAPWPACSRCNVHLTTALVQAAVSASRVRETYFKEKYWCLRARGSRRAAMAVAHKSSIAVA